MALKHIILSKCPKCGTVKDDQFYICDYCGCLIDKNSWDSLSEDYISFNENGRHFDFCDLECLYNWLKKDKNWKKSLGDIKGGWHVDSELEVLKKKPIFKKEIKMIKMAK